MYIFMKSKINQQKNIKKYVLELNNVYIMSKNCFSRLLRAVNTLVIAFFMETTREIN